MLSPPPQPLEMDDALVKENVAEPSGIAGGSRTRVAGFQDALEAVCCFVKS